MPERFPAFESDGLLALPDGSLWGTTFASRAPGYELHLLDPGGVWVGRLTIPARSTLLDAGPDWVLLFERGEFDEHSVAVYELQEREIPASPASTKMSMDGCGPSPIGRF